MLAIEATFSPFMRLDESFVILTQPIFEEFHLEM